MTNHKKRDPAILILGFVTGTMALSGLIYRDFVIMIIVIHVTVLLPLLINYACLCVCLGQRGVRARLLWQILWQMELWVFSHHYLGHGGLLSLTPSFHTWMPKVIHKDEEFAKSVKLLKKKEKEESEFVLSGFYKTKQKKKTKPILYFITWKKVYFNYLYTFLCNQMSTIIYYICMK